MTEFDRLHIRQDGSVRIKNAWVPGFIFVVDEVPLHTILETDDLPYVSILTLPGASSRAMIFKRLLCDPVQFSAPIEDLARAAGAGAFPAAYEELRWKYQDPYFPFYGCSTCYDRYCGGVYGEVTRNEDAFLWTFDEKTFRFRCDAYEATLTAFFSPSPA